MTSIGWSLLSQIWRLNNFAGYFGCHHGRWNLCRSLVMWSSMTSLTNTTNTGYHSTYGWSLIINSSLMLLHLLCTCQKPWKITGGSWTISLQCCHPTHLALTSDYTLLLMLLSHFTMCGMGCAFTIWEAILPNILPPCLEFCFSLFKMHFKRFITWCHQPYLRLNGHV